MAHSEGLGAFCATPASPGFCLALSEQRTALGAPLSPPAGWGVSEESLAFLFSWTVTSSVEPRAGGAGAARPT